MSRGVKSPSRADTPADYSELRLRSKALRTLPVNMRRKPAAAIVADCLALNEALGELIEDTWVLAGFGEVCARGEKG